MAEELGFTERWVRKYLLELENLGLIKREQLCKVDPEFRGNPNARIYTLIPPTIPLRTTVPLGPERPFHRTDKGTNKRKKIMLLFLKMKPL
jgi:hypothetical protein